MASLTSNHNSILVLFQDQALSDHVLWCNEPADIDDALATSLVANETKSDGSQADCKVKVKFEPAYPLAITMFGVDYLGIRKFGQPEQDAVKQQLLAILPIANDKLDLKRVDQPIPALRRPTTKEEFIDINAQLEARRQGGDQSRVYLGVVLDPPTTGRRITDGVAKATEAINGRVTNIANVASGYLSSNYTLAHELGHVYYDGPYRRHVHGSACVGGGWETGADEDYKPVGGLVSENVYGTSAYLGYDALHGSLKLLGLEKYGDLMTYCTRWISEYTYEGIYSYFKIINSKIQGIASAVDPNTPDVAYTLLSGRLDTNSNGVAIDHLYQIQGPGSVPLPTSGPYAIRIEDANGTVVATYPFAPAQDSEGGTSTIFVLLLPYHSNAAKVVLLKDGNVLANRIRSATPPTVTVTSPNGNENFNNGKLNISWSGADADGNPLQYVVQYSADNGTTWQTLAVDLKAPNLEVDVANLPGGNQSLIRVRASDGFNTAEDQSDAVFQVAGKAPWVSIDNAQSGQAYHGEQTIVLYGSAYDLEEGQLADDRFIWRSDLDGDLGQGPSLAVNASDLKEGTHTITLVATDASGNQGSASVQIQVTREYVARAAVLSASPDTL